MTAGLPPRAPSSPAAATDVLRLCREGEALDLAEALINEHATIETVKARIDAERGRRAAAKARETQIRALCAMGGTPELAEDYISGGMSAEAVRKQMVPLKAMLDKVEIDGSIDPNHGVVDHAKSWRSAHAKAQKR
jgi:hypothetical protein